MYKTAYLNRRKEVGGKVFHNFKKSISEDLFKKGAHVEKIMLAADIAEEMPFVTLPLYENGLLRVGERNTHMLHTFQPNLWAQDYAHEQGELAKMTVGTAIERANAGANHVLETSPSVRRVIKKTGTSEYDFYVAMRQAALIESAYYTRLGKGEMPERARKKIDSALLRRTYRNIPFFKTIIDAVGVNGLEGKELVDFSDDIELTEVLQLFVEKDPYYNRRNKQIREFARINSEESAELKGIKTEDFFEEMIVRAIRRFPAMATKIKEVMDEQRTF